MSKVIDGLSIIVPTYNEKNNIPFLLYLINCYVSPLNIDFEVIVVDDNSPDGTANVAERLRDTLGLSLTVVRRPRKLGLGSSYVEGLRHAAFPFVLIMDADLSHHPKYIPEMVARQRRFGYDVVSGTRYARGGGASNWPLRRIFISKSLNYVCRVLFKPSFSDLTGSFRLYKKDLIASVIHQIYNKGFLFQIEMALRCQRMNAKVGEVPIIFVDRIYGSSKFGFSEIRSGIIGLLKLMWEF